MGRSIKARKTLKIYHNLSSLFRDYSRFFAPFFENPTPSSILTTSISSTMRHNGQISPVPAPVVRKNGACDLLQAELRSAFSSYEFLLLYLALVQFKSWVERNLSILFECEHEL